jgi:hypothetical protein
MELLSKSQYHNIPMVRPPPSSRALWLTTLPNECRQFISLFSWNVQRSNPLNHGLYDCLRCSCSSSLTLDLHRLSRGAESIMLFNEGYREFLEEENSKSTMGMPHATAVPELFDVARQIFGEVRDLGRPKTVKAFPASVIVDGAFLREGYFDFVSIPVRDDDLNVVAIYNSVVNRIRDTLEARRSEILAPISAVVDHTIELENTWERIRVSYVAM